MSRHDQKVKDKNFICHNCVHGRCNQCVDILRMVYFDEKICRCRRQNHDGEQNRQQILDPETGTVHAPRLKVTLDGDVIFNE